MARRAANGRSSIYMGKDGYWHGRVTIGIRDDGRPDRRHVQGTTQSSVSAKINELESERRTGSVLRPGVRWTVAQWLRHWLDEIRPHVKPTTFEGYERAVRVHLIPGIGAHKLTALRPEHLEHLYARMLTRITRRGTRMRRAAVHQVHRVVRKALNDAVRFGYLKANPATAARVPITVEDDEEPEPLSVDEIQRVFRSAAEIHNGARFVIALALGLRQGEALGLQWRDIDLHNQVLSVRRSRLRPRYEHGCTEPCGHVHAGYCPERRQIRPPAGSTKSRAGRRTIGLPDPLVLLLRHHQAEQDIERRRAGSLWQEGGWVFTDELGRAVNPRTDWSHWKSLLRNAGVRETRLHDARHTAATCLLLLGTNPRATMAIMGWTDPGMIQRYQHLISPVRAEVAHQLGALLWGDAASAASESPPRDTEIGGRPDVSEAPTQPATPAGPPPHLGRPTVAPSQLPARERSVVVKRQSNETRNETTGENADPA